MKNSLFKRAIAAASALPLALTQCLTTANAANISNAALAAADTAVTADEAKTITLSDEGTGLVYIDPAKAAGATDDGYEKVSELRFEKFSDWNYRVNNFLVGKTRQGKISTKRIYDAAIKHVPGNYKVVAEGLYKRVTNVTYEVQTNGDIIIKGSIDNITPKFVNDTKKTRKTIGGALQSIIDKYGATDLINYNDEKGLFSDIKVGGEFTATIKGSMLAEGTEVEAELKFTDLDGKEYVGTDAMAQYALDALAAYKARAKELVAGSSADIDIADANKKIDDSVKFYEDKIKLGQTKLSNAIAKEIAETAYGTIPAMMEKGSNWFERNGGKLARDYDAPTSVTEAVSKAVVQDLFEKALNAANNAQNIAKVDISLDEIAQFADGDVYDVVASTKDGVSKLTAKFTDKEKDAAIAYIADAAKNATDEKYAGLDYSDTSNWDAWKEVSVEVDFSAVPSSSKGTVDVQLKRVVEVTPVVTTTTTTEGTTTTTTPTDTTPVNPGTDTTPVNPGTDTTPVNPGTDTTPVNTEDISTDTTPVNPGTDTTPVNTEDISTDTTPVNPGTDTTPVNTEDISTDTTPVNPGTDTTPVEVPTDTTPTTKAVEEVVVHYNGAGTVGFYLNIDDAFKKEQIKDLTYSYDRTILYIDETGEIVGEQITVPGTKYSIADKVDFGTQVPSNTYDAGSSIFAYQVKVYAAEDIVDANGNVIAAKGSVLQNANKSDVSVTAYIALKGDGNLDNMVDAVDASLAMAWFANMSTGGNPETTKFTNNIIVNTAEDILDHFCAFLTDVDNEKSETNWSDMKPARTINATDASFILAYYANNSTGGQGGKPEWSKVLGEYAPY